jgi:hypothetical protein
MNCKNCKHWKKIKDDEYQKDVGECSLLSGEWIEKDKEELYPDIETTGIESSPICGHDGIGIWYETKSWFGCVGFEKIEETKVEYPIIHEL